MHARRYPRTRSEIQAQRHLHAARPSAAGQARPNRPNSPGQYPTLLQIAAVAAAAVGSRVAVAAAPPPSSATVAVAECVLSVVAGGRDGFGIARAVAGKAGKGQVKG